MWIKDARLNGILARKLAVLLPSGFVIVTAGLIELLIKDCFLQTCRPRSFYALFIADVGAEWPFLKAL